MTKRQSRIMPLPAVVKARWDSLRAALDTAAQPFTGKNQFVLSIMHLHEVIGAEEALDRAMAEVRKAVPDPLHGVFVLRADGPAIEVSWIGDA